MANEKQLIKIRKRAKFAGDVHQELLKAGWDLETATLFVNNITDADAVEVVRCKECYYFTEHNDFRSGRHLGYGECHRLRGELFKDEDFCSYGERKDNG